MKVNIIKFDHFGRGIGKLNQKIVFVDKALPGEIVDVKITQEKKNYYEARINKIIKKNLQRVEAICPYYDKCGGCNLLHMSYEEEKRFKIIKGEELLGKINKLYETKGLNYRNKVTLHVKNNKIGFYKENTNEIVTIDYCYLLNDRINRIISDLKNISVQDYGITRIVIKEGNNQTLLWVDKMVDNFFVDYFSYVDTIICDSKIVKGNGFIEEKIDNKIFKITPNAFFQVNNEGLKNISIIIKEFLQNIRINQALDLYSGTALWGILVSNYVNKVTSIEINKEACLNAIDNIKKNNITNIEIINGDVSNFIDKFTDIDLVIIDPPRSGLDKKTREYINNINSKYIIYISCDMKTLERDLDELKKNYNIKSINLVDMFKRTYHCESICLLCGKIIDK